MGAWRLRLVVLSYVLLCAVAGCDDSEESVDPGDESSTSNAGGDEGAGGSADPCAEIISKVERALGDAQSACSTDADCGCYPGGLGPESGCGGVTDAKTADRVHELAADYRRAGCQPTRQCEPWRCEPRCLDGHCRRAE